MNSSRSNFSLSAPHTRVLLLEDTIVDLAPLGIADSLTAVQAGTDALLQAANMPACSHISPSAVRLLAPIPQPPRIFCIGLNYRDHAVESKMEIPKVPTVFLKLASAVIVRKNLSGFPRSRSNPTTKWNSPLSSEKPAGTSQSKTGASTSSATPSSTTSARATSNWPHRNGRWVELRHLLSDRPNYRHCGRNPRPA